MTHVMTHKNRSIRTSTQKEKFAMLFTNLPRQNPSKSSLFACNSDWCNGIGRSAQRAPHHPAVKLADLLTLFRPPWQADHLSSKSAKLIFRHGPPGSLRFSSLPGFGRKEVFDGSSWSTISQQTAHSLPKHFITLQKEAV
jgi:hypothetical protein